MSHHLLTVSIFCFICATHSPCASHAAVGHFEQNRYDGYRDPSIPGMEQNPELNLREKLLDFDQPEPDVRQFTLPDNDSNKRQKRQIGNDADIVKKIFQQYGDGDKMTLDGLEKMLTKLDMMSLMADKLHEHEDHNDNITCVNPNISTLKQSTQQTPLNHSTFVEACPVLLYSLLADHCAPSDPNTFNVSAPANPGIDGKIWLYSSLAVLLISVCGVGSLVIIPLMQKRFYKPLIQFLVALAVGTLAGDALLHLLPHAMGSHGHDHQDDHEQNTFKGLVAMMGLTFFFIMERLILVAGKWRKQKQKHKTVPHAHVQVFDDQGERRNSTQCMDKYNTSPYCYKDIMTETRSNDVKHNHSPAMERLEANQNITDNDLISTPCIEAKMLPHEHEDFTVIVREHTTDHHGHSHKHGHVHSAPQNYSSVAWMVIMGDGLHNFTDGMAIGAAFASGIAGGFSTTVAVFCHELPHELGDFAMLLKAGMSIRQALFYNLLSSGLCILGNFVGLYLGNTETANQWVFAAAAGTFIYIALVDMIPELTSAHDDEENLIQCVLHLSGLMIGVGIMTVIALYEHDLKHMFHEE